MLKLKKKARNNLVLMTVWWGIQKRAHRSLTPCIFLPLGPGWSQTADRLVERIP